MKVPDSGHQVKRGGAPFRRCGVLSIMIPSPFMTLAADTLLVRPVAMPTPWYSVATGVLSIVVTLLLLGIAIALLGMVRAMKNAENRLGSRVQGLADELIPLARNLNGAATQLSGIAETVRGDLARLSGTVSAVDDAVRDTLDAGEKRLREFGALIDVVQGEAEATVASASSLMRGVRTGVSSFVTDALGTSDRNDRASRTRSRHTSYNDRPSDDRDVRARLAALESAFDDIEADDDDYDDEHSENDTHGDDVAATTRRGPKIRHRRDT